jgi:hypothetical protein
MKKILQFWIDYDGCFNSAHIKGSKTLFTNSKNKQVLMLEKNKPIIFKGPIIEHMCGAIFQLQPDLVEICTFSNRQDPKTDNKNCARFGSLSSYEIFTALTLHFQQLFPAVEIHNDQFLLADTYTQPYEPGKIWRDTLDKLSKKPDGTPFTDAQTKHFPEGVIAHKHKIDLFYCKAQHACLQHGGDIVHAIGYDDSENILETLHKLYTQHPQLLPRNFSADLFAFTSMSDKDPEAEEVKEAAYLAPSPLRAHGEKAVGFTANTCLLPGVEKSYPEPFPYTSLNGHTFFNKRKLVEYHIKNRLPIEYVKSALEVSLPFSPSLRICGSGLPNPNGHLLNKDLNTHFPTLIHGSTTENGLADIWATMSDINTSGHDSGAWAGSDSLLNIIFQLSRTPRGNYFPSSKHLHASWLELQHNKYSRMRLPQLEQVLNMQTLPHTAKPTSACPIQ